MMIYQLHLFYSAFNQWEKMLYIAINNLRNSAIQSEEIIFFYATGKATHYQSTMTSPRLFEPML